MKTVQQIMEESGAKANIENFRYMQEHYTYRQKVRHAENVARSFEEQCRERGLNCHVSVGGLDSITLHYFLQECGINVPCVSCSTLEQRGVQAVHKRIAEEMQARYQESEWLSGHMALPQREIDAIQSPGERAREQELLNRCPTLPRMYFLKPLLPKTKVIEQFGWPVLTKSAAVFRWRSRAENCCGSWSRWRWNGGRRRALAAVWSTTAHGMDARRC